MKNPPSAISFKVQDLRKDWPQEDQNKYDLVHQRYCLAQFNEQQDAEIIKNLLGLVKPRGYLQFVEADMTSFETGPDHGGMTKFIDYVTIAFPQVNMNASPGPKIKGWLEDAGAIDVKEEIFTFKMGAAADDEEFRKATEENLMVMIDNFSTVTSSESSASFIAAA